MQQIKSLISIIDNESFKRIKRAMQAAGIRQSGFSKLENVPTQIFINACNNNGNIKTSFLKQVIIEYLGENIQSESDLPEINNHNIQGHIAYYIYNSYDDDLIESLFSKAAIPNENYAINNPNEEEHTTNKKENDNKLIQGEKIMNTYLGYVDIRTNNNFDNKYYNFYPQFEIIDGKAIAIENAKEQFPEYGNYRVLTYKGFIFEDNFKNKEFCIIQLEDSDIEENLDWDGNFKSTYYRIKFQELLEQGKIHKLGEKGYKIYPIVQAKSPEVNFFDARIEVVESFPINKYMTESILFYKGKYYGPFYTGNREIDNQNYIMPKLAENNYLINEYSIVDYDGNSYLTCDIGNDREQNFLCINDCVEVNTIDKLTDEKLLNQFSESLKANENDNFDAIKSELEAFRSSEFITIPGNPNISQRRINRITAILSDIGRVEDCYSETANIIDGLFSASNNGEILDKVLVALMDKKDFLDKIQDFRIVRNKINEENEKLELLNEKIENAQKEFDDAQEKLNEISAKVIDDKQEELNAITNKIVEQENNLTELQQKYNLSNDVKQLIKDREYYERQLDEIKPKIQELENHISAKIDDANRSTSNIMFDEHFDRLVSDNLSNYTAISEKKKEEEKYDKITKQLLSIPTHDFKNEEFIAYLVSKVQKYRPEYDKNTILNLFICMTQNFITIFSGNPGTGKTSICNIIAHVLHLDKIENETLNSDCFINRYVQISVERGWNSKRELIGYYNPLSGKVEKSNSDFYDALRILNAERENSHLPMLVLLDEANLSPIEYYWADFNNICDSDSNHDVNLGNDEHLYIPTSLRFVATINNDHTTETISPRIIDRAFIISLPSSKASNISTTDLNDNDAEQVSWDTLKRCFSLGDKKIQKEPNDILNKICEMFATQFQEVSQRSRKAVETYCAVAQNYFERVQNADPSIVALDYAVSQKIITKISGNGDTYRAFLDKLNEFCKSKNLNITSYQLDKIIRVGDNSMKYYQYFC